MRRCIFDIGRGTPGRIQSLLEELWKIQQRAAPLEDLLQQSISRTTKSPTKTAPLHLTKPLLARSHQEQLFGTTALSLINTASQMSSITAKKNQIAIFLMVPRKTKRSLRKICLPARRPSLTGVEPCNPILLALRDRSATVAMTLQVIKLRARGSLQGRHCLARYRRCSITIDYMAHIH